MQKSILAGALAVVLTAIGFSINLGTWAARAANEVEVDTALVVSVDVSNSVDANRYRLQMEGIAEAFEDPEVLRAILNGPHGGILVSMVTWADKPRVAIPWQLVRSAEDAKDIARKVRALPRQTGEFTCVTGMLRNISDKLIPQIPGKANRVIVDVSGEGRENCNP